MELYMLHVGLGISACLHEVECGKSLGIEAALVEKDCHHGNAHDFSLCEYDFFLNFTESLALSERTDVVEAGFDFFKGTLAALVFVIKSRECLEIF